MRKILLLALILISSISFANENAHHKKKTQTTHTAASQTTTEQPKNVVLQRVKQEQAVLNNPFLITFYQPTYIIPFYVSQSPYRQIYVNNTPDNEGLNNYEVKYQFSFKLPIWYHMFDTRSSIYVAYTQLSYWQAYNNSAFFRETNYEPEIFLANQINWQLPDGWEMVFTNLGLVHESNGKGGDLERSWNRMYLDNILSKGNWFVSIKPWIVFHDQSLNRYNPDIAKYLGYESATVGYKYHKQIFSFQTENTVESGFSRGSMQFSWSFPLTTHLNGYIQLFSGFGQSLIEYDHYTNGVGIGISLSNWI